MIRSDIKITRMQSASVIHSPSNFISYDHKAGESNSIIKCITTFYTDGKFLQDLQLAKIITIESIDGQDQQGYASVMLLLKPEFGYTNQKLEDILSELFEKYNL